LRPKLLAPTLLLLLACALSTTGCTSCGQQVLCALRGPVNDPSNLSLRRSILAMGLSEFCHQMLMHNAPLKMTDESPVIGRFYPQHCTQKDLPSGDLYVTFDGFGYAFTNLSKKLTFTMSGAVDYNQDFRVAGDCNIYAYFQTRQVTSSNFQSHVVEQPVAAFLNSLTQVGDSFGRQLVSGKLGEGFTVIRAKDGNIDFGLGIIPEGQRPQHPFAVHGGDRAMYENLRTEVHQNEREFIGPIEVTDSGRALFVTATVDGGVEALDVLLMTKADGDVSLGLYYNYPAVGPLNANVLASDVIPGGAKQYQHAFPVPKGVYYVVLDNSGAAGQVAPPLNLFDDRVATVSYAVQIGDRP
jgi:hypothetical protein